MLLGGEEAGRGIGQLGMGRLTSGRDAAHSGPSFGGGGGEPGDGVAAYPCVAGRLVGRGQQEAGQGNLLTYWRSDVSSQGPSPGSFHSCGAVWTPHPQMPMAAHSGPPRCRWPVLCNDDQIGSGVSSPALGPLPEGRFFSTETTLVRPILVASSPQAEPPLPPVWSSGG